MGVLGMIGLIGGLVLLIYLTMRGVNILIVGPVSALFVAVLSGMPLFEKLAAEGEGKFCFKLYDWVYRFYHVVVFNVLTRCSIR